MCWESRGESHKLYIGIPITVSQVGSSKRKQVFFSLCLALLLVSEQSGQKPPNKAKFYYNRGGPVGYKYNNVKENLSQMWLCSI